MEKRRAMLPQIRQAMEHETQAILDLTRAAFGEGQGDEIAILIEALLRDATAYPLLSLVAVEDGQVIGHVLFTAVTLEQCAIPVSASILAPLSVHPAYQKRGTGGLLIREGLRQLRDRGVDLVFVLGYPAYYPKHGFTPAGVKGYAAPHAIAPEHAEAWMVQELQPGMMQRGGGMVRCARTLNDPKYWQE